MDAFEGIVARVLEKKGYWVRRSVKVFCTPDEKAQFGGRSAPTPEVDIACYDGEELLLVEVKSFLDSDGVRYEGVTGLDADDGKKYKLLNNSLYQNLMKDKIIKEFKISPRHVKFCLAAGNIYAKDIAEIEKYFSSNANLRLIKPDEIADGLINLSNEVYINDEITMTIKLLKNQNRIS